MDRRMKAYTAALGACGLVGAAAMTDSGLPNDLRPIGGDGVHLLPKGTPLVQVIPFARELVEADVRAETEDEAGERKRAHRSTLAGEGWYRARSRGR